MNLSLALFFPLPEGEGRVRGQKKHVFGSPHLRPTDGGSVLWRTHLLPSARLMADPPWAEWEKECHLEKTAKLKFENLDVEFVTFGRHPEALFAEGSQSRFCGKALRFFPPEDGPAISRAGAALRMTPRGIRL